MHGYMYVRVREPLGSIFGGGGKLTFSDPNICNFFLHTCNLFFLKKAHAHKVRNLKSQDQYIKRSVCKVWDTRTHKRQNLRGGPAHTVARSADAVNNWLRADSGVCMCGAARPNFRTLALSFGTSGNTPTASMPAAGRPHCVLHARYLKCWRFF
jgi:hypothetical protein